MMEVKILGHRKAAEFLENCPNEWDVIFISDPENTYHIQGSSKIAGLAKECCEILFWDTRFPIGRMGLPEREHVQKAVDFAKGRDKILVCCQMGRSRSSSTAYVIYAAEVGPIKALDILHPLLHEPNPVVVQHGADILGQPNMVDIIRIWLQQAEEMSWDTGPELS